MCMQSSWIYALKRLFPVQTIAATAFGRVEGCWPAKLEHAFKASTSSLIDSLNENKKRDGGPRALIRGSNSNGNML